MNVLKAGWKGECYEWYKRKKKLGYNVLIVVVYI